MTRLETASRDFAIACLANGDWMSAEDALARIGEHATADALQKHHPYRSFDFGPSISSPRIVWRGDRRVGARVALWLRLLRRVEVWERGEWGRAGWAGVGVVQRTTRGDWTGHVGCGALRHMSAPWTAIAWRPLWLDAPPYSADITPRQRRGW